MTDHCARYGFFFFVFPLSLSLFWRRRTAVGGGVEGGAFLGGEHVTCFIPLSLSLLCLLWLWLCFCIVCVVWFKQAGPIQWLCGVLEMLVLLASDCGEVNRCDELLYLIRDVWMDALLPVWLNSSDSVLSLLYCLAEEVMDGFRPSIT